MAQVSTAGVLAQWTEVADAPADRGGALWRLAATGRQVDANVIRLPAGERVETHREPDLDVLLCVLSGSGEVETDGRRQPLEGGSLVWLPRGARRSLTAGSEALVYLTAHRRRPGLAIAGADGQGYEGGEPACMLNRICTACDRPADDPEARFCARCGTRLPS
ncbi:cupin domain-containing protein [Streptomyces sp. NPDC005963]|uniref:cupin domain-containing protein n=1 Tax=Streptomyces sp. NPDC005963 TaxID=3156721 RepID=UPI0033D3AD5B